jgi:hypothetical protein
MNMTAPYKWTVGLADAYASFYGPTVQDFLSLVVQPSLAALELKRQELASNPNDAVAVFGLFDHEQLISQTQRAFALAIQSLLEQHLRTYLTTCARGQTIEGVTQKKLETGTWGKVLNGVFFKVRGLELDKFDSFPVLSQLWLLGNACRHGDGDSARDLHALHPELWPKPPLFPWLNADATAVLPPPVHTLQITLEVLQRYVAAIALFWMDMQRLGVETLVEKQPALQSRVADLLEQRVPLLAIVTR